MVSLLSQFLFASVSSDYRATVLLMKTNSTRGEGFGLLFLQDLQTGTLDTLVRTPASSACFSPDGRYVAYKDSATQKIHTINIYTRQITDYTNVSPTGWFGNTLSWCRDGIYFAVNRSVYRLNLPAGTVDHVYHAKLTAIISTITDTNKIDLTQGGVSYDGTRGCFTVVTDNSGSMNHVWSMDFSTGTEAILNDNTTGSTGGRLSCQADISYDGLYCAHTNYSHSTGIINPFNQNSIQTQIWGGNSFWFFRYPINTAAFVFYRLNGDSITYLRDIEHVNSIPVSRFPFSVYDAYFGGWLLDTIAPNPPTSLTSGVRTDKTIQLIWNAPSSGPTPTEYIIKRNGVEIATVTGTNYVDQNLVENTTYAYSVESRTIGIRFSAPLTGSISTTTDTYPPVPTQSFSLSTTTVDVLFSEPVDSLSAATKTNYSMDAAVSVSSAARPGVTRARLTTAAFTTITDTLIRVTGVKDKAVVQNQANGASCPVTLVRNMWISSNKGTWAYLDSGVYVWCDDDFPPAYFTVRSPKYNGLPFFQTSVSDGTTDSTQEFIRFTINRPLEIIVLSQKDSTHVQGWLRDPSWKKSVDAIGNIYSKVFPAGTVSLKGNGFTKYTTYNVILKNVDPLSNSAISDKGKLYTNPLGPQLTYAPTPFSNQVRLSGILPDANSRFSLIIYNMEGQVIRTLKDEKEAHGRFTTEWDGKDAQGNSLSNGLYLCKLIINGKLVSAERLVLLR